MGSSSSLAETESQPSLQLCSITWWGFPGLEAMIEGTFLKADLTPISDFHALYCKPFNNGHALLGPSYQPPAKRSHHKLRDGVSDSADDSL